MAAEGEAVTERAAGGEQRLGHPVGHEHGPHRRVGGRQSLGHRGQIGHDALALDPEPLAEAAEAADDLVGDQQRAVFVGQLSQPRPVPRGRDEAATRVLHRLGDDHRHLVGASGLDRVADLGQQPGGERLGIVAVDRAERVGVGDADDLDRRWPERLLHRLDAGERQRAQG